MLGITTSGVNIENIQLALELEKNNITNIDCAITNLVSKKWEHISVNDIHKLSEEYKRSSIGFNSIQSVFYGKSLDFNNSQHHKQIVEHMKTICKYGSILNCRKVLFGSPRQRKDTGSRENFIKIFKTIDSIMSDNGFIFNIENLERCPDILLQRPVEIISFINEHNLKSCKLNLHLFVEDQGVEDSLLKHNLLDTIHLSNYEYTDKILLQQLPLLKRVLNKIQDHPSVKIVEFQTNNTLQMLKKISNM